MEVRQIQRRHFLTFLLRCINAPYDVCRDFAVAIEASGGWPWALDLEGGLSRASAPAPCGVLSARIALSIIVWASAFGASQGGGEGET